MCSRPPCFGELYQDKWRPLDGSRPFGSLLQAVHSRWQTHSCMHVWPGGKERRGSTPGRSHPRQITICTRHLRAELSGWRENKRTENGSELGEWGPVLSGCSQVLLSGCQSYCIHRSRLCHVQSMETKTLQTRTAQSTETTSTHTQHFFFFCKNQDNLMHNPPFCCHNIFYLHVCMNWWSKETMTDVLEAKLCMKSEWKVSGKTGTIYRVAEERQWIRFTSVKN